MILFKAVFLIFLSFFASSCGASKSNEWFNQNGKLKVLTTTAMISDIVAEIGKEDVDTMPLIQGELDPHSYELVKGDDEKFAMADLIFYNGLGLEHGLSLKQNLEHNPQAFSVGDPILRENPKLILMVSGQYDPHIWMDIDLWMRIVKTIVNNLSAKDPRHAKNYENRAQELLMKMKEADQQVYDRLQSIPQEKRYLVTSHDAFNYFARRYLSTEEERQNGKWKMRFEAPEGLAPDAQLSVTDIQSIISHIKKYKIHVLFPESNVSQDSLNKILSAAQEQGFEVRISKKKLYGDAMGKVGSDGDKYLSMIIHNANVISGELDQ